MPSPTIFSYSLLDDSGVTASVDLFVSYDAATETVAALLATASAFGGLLDAVTGLKITEFNLRINALPDPDWKTAPIAGTDPEKTLLENFRITDSKYVQEFDVPGIRQSLISADKTPIIGSGAIAAMNTAIVGSLGTGVAAQSKFLLDLTALVDASISFRKHRKKRKAVSLVIP